MQLHKIRGGSEEELRAHTYTIGVGVSLGSKWFSIENIVTLVKWSLEYSKDFVVVYVADSIHAINLEVRKGISHENALHRANELGDEILAAVKIAIKETFSDTEIERIKFAKWADVAGPTYQKDVSFLYSQYESDLEFKETIHEIVNQVVSGENREFSIEQIHHLGTYILEEMPEVLKRVPIGGIVCDAYVYPYDGELTRLVERIQKGEVFSGIKEAIVTTYPKVFLEVR